MTTRALTEQVMSLKAIVPPDEHSCALVPKAVFGSLSRAEATIQRVEIAGVACGGSAKRLEPVANSLKDRPRAGFALRA